MVLECLLMLVVVIHQEQPTHHRSDYLMFLNHNATG